MGLLRRSFFVIELTSIIVKEGFEKIFIYEKEKFMTLKIIGFLMVITGISILGWLIITAYKVNKNESFWIKILLIVGVMVEFSLDIPGVILFFVYVLILIGVCLMFYV